MTSAPQGPETADVETDADTEPDTQSDPALDGPTGDQADWSSEGGATPSGPATDTDDDDA